MDQFNELCSNGEVSGPCSDSDIRQAENELGVKFPSQYKEFLSKCGAALLGGVEVYGLPNPETNDPPVWQNVVTVTKQLRSWGQAGTEKPSLVPIAEDGTGVYFFVDTHDFPNTTIFAIGPGVEKKMSSDFFEFIVNLSEGKITL
jgi:cell wall assembly regulator SMI1